MDEQQLFTGALEGWVLSGHWVPGEGWFCRLQLRRQYEQWEDSRAESYDHLSTDELASVIEGLTGSLWSALGL